METKNKYCPKCETEKPVKEFYKNFRTSDGLFANCKDCQKKNVKKKPENPYRFY